MTQYKVFVKGYEHMICLHNLQIEYQEIKVYESVLSRLPELNFMHLEYHFFYNKRLNPS